MKLLLIGVFYNFCVDIILAINSTCGIDSSPVTVVYEGIASVDTYPWMGYLYYTSDNTRYTTTAVLVTKQIVIAGASEIDRLPKDDFRAVTRVVVGNPCGQNEIRVRDYTFHPEYETNTYSALAIIQLDIDNVKQELRPICPPPAHFANPKFYAMTMVKGCKNPNIRIYTMEYVDINKCKHFYRKSGLDQKSFWPTHTTCARAISGGKCLWHSGSVLTIKQGGRWRMLGFSTNGPGCGDPSRFLDYGKYHKWIQRSVSSFGHPAISRLRDNYVVMRRSLSNVQRFGPCDREEVKFELYSDKVTIIYRPGQFNGKYNLTLIAGIEYSCIIFQAKPLKREDYKSLEVQVPDPYVASVADTSVPKIHLRRWCASPTAMCYGFQNIDVHFYVEIKFSQSIEFTVSAFGKTAKVISPRSAMKLVNKGKRPRIYFWIELIIILHLWKNLQKHQWFYNVEK